MLVTQREVTQQSYERYKNNLTKPIGLSGTDTGHHILNMITGGWTPTKIVTIAGRSGSGKSSLVTQILAEAGNVIDGRSTEVIMFSWEMHGSFMADRYVCWRVGITLPELRYSSVLPANIKEKINKAYAECAKIPVSFHHYSSNIDAVIKQIDEWSAGVDRKCQIDGVKRQKLMILDFIGMISGSSKYSVKTYDTGEFMQKLKQHLNDTGIAALILAQINRSADSKEAPDVSDLSDSQFIEQNSDVVVLLDRPEYRRKETMFDPETGGQIPCKNMALFKVVKNREGRIEDYLGRCDIGKFRFWHRDMAFEEDYKALYKKEEFWRSIMAK